ncbi:MAG: SOS response-associated peptidase [Bacteroidota bacterium]
MCGRYSYTQPMDPDQVVLPIETEGIIRPRYNIAPSQWAPIIPDHDAGHIHFYRWGLIPHWAKDMKIGYRMINARSETILEKNSFKTPMRKYRCLVPADGFYEWKKEGSSKQPYRITLASKEEFYMAGLYSFWNHPDGSLIPSFTVITTAPNELMAPIHNRMPVIFDKDEAGRWLDRGERPENLLDMLDPYPAEEMYAYPVSKDVGNVRNDHEGLIKEVGKQGGLFD